MKRKDVPKLKAKPYRRAVEVSDTYIRKGILWLMGSLGLLSFLILGARLAKVMLLDHEYYESKAISNQTRSTPVTAKRGELYDRNMDPLAGSLSVENIFLDPLELKQNEVDLKFLSQSLGELLDLDPEEILKKAQDTSMRYKVLKRKQPPDLCNALRAFLAEHDIKGVHLEPDSLRYYPYGATASQLLGFVNTENVGTEGLESRYNKTLQGTPGTVITTKGNHETEMLYSYETYYEAKSGKSLVLTIDLTVQRALEKQMQDAIDRYDVLNGAFGMVMDADTGEILAMSTLGGYDPNHYQEIYDEDTRTELEQLYERAMTYPKESPERSSLLEEYNAAMAAARLKQWRNRCVCDGYEPGSTFKALTLAAALDSGAVTLQDHFSCGGSEKFEGRSQILNCWRSAGHGGQTTAQALQNSCNLAFAHIGLRTGGESLYEYYKAFGLMETTGLDLPGEARGIFHSKEHLANNKVHGTSYLISTSFGQTVKPTPIQMVRAIAAVVNGGYLLEPYVVSQVLDEDGTVLESRERTVLRQVISEKTSRTMCELLESVVAEGTAKNANVAGYRIGGKTGTSEKTDQRNEDGQMTRDKIVSFVGIAPMEDPRYVVLIALDTPNPATGQYISGGVMAAPTVGAVLEDILPYLGVQADYTKDELYRVNVPMPNVEGLTIYAAQDKLKEANLQYRIVGKGSKVLSQLPGKGKPVPCYSTVVLYTDSTMTEEAVAMPSLYGLTVEETVRKLNDLGLYLQPKGTESTAWHVLAANQSIPPGTMVERGTTVTVTFTDTKDMD
ncbi:MAG: PASTA domain-containing protein [Oscillospiraceae bacterium]|nr:PASTA domain-containing protein [Oscillospiraceae bacterium]